MRANALQGGTARLYTDFPVRPLWAPKQRGVHSTCANTIRRVFRRPSCVPPDLRQARDISLRRHRFVLRRRPNISAVSHRMATKSYLADRRIGEAIIVCHPPSWRGPPRIAKERSHHDGPVLRVRASAESIDRSRSALLAMAIAVGVHEPPGFNALHHGRARG